MLVLSRKPDQDVNIGEDIQVTVLSIKGRQVRLGFTAPDDVLILRGELEDTPVNRLEAVVDLNKSNATSR